MARFKQPSLTLTIEAVRPWLRGFIHKEYGKHANVDDFDDLEQEGYTKLIELLTAMAKKPNRFQNEEEYYFYIKAVMRNAIRDYMLKFRSRFGISLFKLRREIKGNDDQVGQQLGDLMHSIGEQFVAQSDLYTEDPTEYAIRQRRLSLLSIATKNCRDLDLAASQKLLLDVIEEYKKTETITTPFEATGPKTISPNATVTEERRAFVTRTPVPSDAPAKIKKCASRFCENELRNLKTVVVDRGFGYCSKRCKKEWPPVINRIQANYGNTPIETILFISLKLFRSKRRAAEILEIASSTLEKLVERFNVE